MLTQADLNRIDAAIATGTTVVVYGDRRVEYRSIQELKEARRHVAEQLAAAAGSRPAGITTRRIAFSTRREG